MRLSPVSCLMVSTENLGHSIRKNELPATIWPSDPNEAFVGEEDNERRAGNAEPCRLMRRVTRAPGTF